MPDPFLGEIAIFGFNFAPRGWAFCDGQILPINQNQSLYSLIGTTYGGDGRTSFALPDLRGRTPVHFGGLFLLGAKTGEESHMITESEMPAHDHTLMASSLDGDVPVPRDVANNLGHVLARSVNEFYIPTQATHNPMNADSIASTGASQGHQNMQPYLVLNFCIALQGLFPGRK